MSDEAEANAANVAMDLGGRSAAPSPPRMYRAMKPDGVHPMTGASATTLGARAPKDLAVDTQGRVRPRIGGMSVRPRLLDMPAAFLPGRLKHLNRNAGGSNTVVVFRFGDAPFAAEPVTQELSLRPDAPDHGVVEPSTEMNFDAYQQALWATRERWVNGES